MGFWEGMGLRCRRPTLVSVEWWYLACRVPPHIIAFTRSYDIELEE